MKKVKQVLSGIFLLLTCVFLFGTQPAMADEGQGLNEPGDIRNAAQYFWDTADRFIIGRNVRMRTTAEVNDSNVVGEFHFGEPVQIVAETGDWCQVKVVINDLISEVPARFVHKDFIGSWEQVENKMKVTSPYIIELNRLNDVILSINVSHDPDGSTPVQPSKTKREIEKEILYYQNKIPGIRAYINGSGLPQATVDSMLEALQMQETIFGLQLQRLTDPQKGEEISGLGEMLDRKLDALMADYL